MNQALASAGSLTNHDTEVVVVHSDDLTVDDPAFKEEVHALRDELAALPETDVVGVISAYDDGLDTARRDGLTSEDGHTTLLTVELNDLVRRGRQPHGRRLRRGDGGERRATASTSPSPARRPSASDAQDLASADLSAARPSASPWRSSSSSSCSAPWSPPALPLVLSIFAIVVGLAITVLIGHVFELSIFALNVLTAMGLAVGIDYSLFIVSRYREERAGGLEKLDGHRRGRRRPPPTPCSSAA